MSKGLSIDSLASKINSSWQKTKEGLLTTAQHCSRAKDSLSKEDKKALLKQLDFSPSTFSMLAKIGSNEQLHAEPVRPVLPSRLACPQSRDQFLS